MTDRTRLPLLPVDCRGIYSVQGPGIVAGGRFCEVGLDAGTYQIDVYATPSAADAANLAQLVVAQPGRGVTLYCGAPGARSFIFHLPTPSQVWMTFPVDWDSLIYCGFEVVAIKLRNARDE